MDSEPLNGVEHTNGETNGAEFQTNGTNGDTNGNEVVPEPELIKLTAIQVGYMKIISFLNYLRQKSSSIKL
jgi:hypothetical protein